VQVSALHAWACVLGLELTLTAYPGTTEFVAAFPPLSAQLVLGSDLDPASSDDLRHVVALATASDGFVVAGIQQTESPPAAEKDAAAAEEKAVAPPPPHHHHHHHHHHSMHDHSGVKGNAYNFAASAQHASTFDLLQGQLSGLPCLRTATDLPLGCVEAAHNWFASLCDFASLGELTATRAPLADALHEFTNGWPLGGRLAERCAGQRHFLGYVDGGESVRNPYLLRQLMGFCMFHGCREVALIGEADLAGHGVAAEVVGGANVSLFVEAGKA
jgi:hypothetical protein